MKMNIQLFYEVRTTMKSSQITNLKMAKQTIKWNEQNEPCSC